MCGYYSETNQIIKKMKTKLFLLAAISAIFTLTTVSCDKTVADNQINLLEVDEEGTTMMTKSAVAPLFDATDPLTADEIEFLYAMREDEKVARDVYKVFAEKYPTAPQIARIGKAEASHIACIEEVLSFYEIEFPAIGEYGVFVDANRQATYDKLVAQGTTLLDAFLTMAFIEEDNIAAYKNVLPTIANPNIKLVVEHLMKASSNHLRAAARRIKVLGGTYTPTVLSQADFDAIINAKFDKGQGFGKGKGNNGNTNSEKGGKGSGKKGSVNQNGDCTSTTNGTAPGNGSSGKAGKGYRWGKK